MTSVTITAMGHFLPGTFVPNAFFDSLDNGSESMWIKSRTGIESRYSVLGLDDIAALRWKKKTYQELRQEGRIPSMATLCKTPWEIARARLGDAAWQPEVVVCGTSVPDYDIPANAAVIANALGLHAAHCFDANSACSSFLTDLMVMHSLLQGGAFKSGAIFNPERYSLRMDYSDRKNSILFGDGIAVATLSAAEDARGLRIIDVLAGSDPTGYDRVVIPEGGDFWQNGMAVQKFAIGRTCQATNEILTRNDLSVRDLRFFIGHQANLRMLSSVCERLGVSADQHRYNVDRCGNQGAAGAPIVLSTLWDELNPGDLVVVTVVGAGLTWGSVLLEMQL